MASDFVLVAAMFRDPDNFSFEEKAMQLTTPNSVPRWSVPDTLATQLLASGTVLSQDGGERYDRGIALRQEGTDGDAPDKVEPPQHVLPAEVADQPAARPGPAMLDSPIKASAVSPRPIGM